MVHIQRLEEFWLNRRTQRSNSSCKACGTRVGTVEFCMRDTSACLMIKRIQEKLFSRRINVLECL